MIKKIMKLIFKEIFKKKTTKKQRPNTQSYQTEHRMKYFSFLIIFHFH